MPLVRHQPHHLFGQIIHRLVHIFGWNIVVSLRRDAQVVFGEIGTVWFGIDIAVCCMQATLLLGFG